jgi:F-type H+-transporting ATPase subunit gamma
MSSLKEIRTRISSVSSTRQITSAMKMVSAAKLKRAQDSILRLRPYAIKLQEIINNLGNDPEISAENIYLKKRKINKVLLIVISSNRGMCGAFNSSVLKKSLSVVEESYSQQFKEGNVSFITIGKKAFEYLKNKKYNVISSRNDLLDNPSFNEIASFCQTIMNDYREEKYDKIEIIYNQFKNAAFQIITEDQFLPVEIKPIENKSNKNYDYIFEPSKEEIIVSLIPKSIYVHLFKAILDSIAGEHGARMTAMHKATDNATELIKDLKLHYNKVRQASITKEILEIVGGAEALKGH